MNNMDCGIGTYPRIVIDMPKLKHNVSYVTGICREKGIEVAGVIKGASGLVPVAKAFDEGGASQIASSRLEQLAGVKEAGIDKPTLMLRVPMLSEVSEVVKYADISLNSDEGVLRALNDAAASAGKIHGVIVMVDMGDLREGYWDKDEAVRVCGLVEEEMDNLELLGIGTNVGCYGSVLPTKETLNDLITIAENVEEHIGRTLRFISGGATSSVMRVMDGDIPERINHLRVGEGILLARDWEVFYGYDMHMMYQDAFYLEAEVIEVKDKPSHPIGTLGVDAFGRTPEYVDRGIRKRALVAVGKADISDGSEIFPVNEGIEILGGSSDHTILDIEDAKDEIKVGDVLKFIVNYASLLPLTSSVNVKKVFIE